MKMTQNSYSLQCKTWDGVNMHKQRKKNLWAELRYCCGDTLCKATTWCMQSQRSYWLCLPGRKPSSSVKVQRRQTKVTIKPFCGIDVKNMLTNDTGNLSVIEFIRYFQALPASPLTQLLMQVITTLQKTE